MTIITIPADAHRFFADLQQDKAWWDAHKADYRADVEQPLQQLLERGSDRFGGAVKLFRPYRDTRFSADKSPYRTEAMGGLGAPGDLAIRYVAIDAEGTTVGGGAPMPSKDKLAATRGRIADDEAAAAELQAVLDALADDGFELPDAPLKTAPRGFSRDHPWIGLLKRTAFAAERRLPPTGLAEPDVFATWERLEPLMRWLRSI